MVSVDLTKFARRRDNARHGKPSYTLVFRDLSWDKVLYYNYDIIVAIQKCQIPIHTTHGNLDFFIYHRHAYYYSYQNPPCIGGSAKGRPLFSSVEQVKLTYTLRLIFQEKCTIFWLNTGLGV